MDEPDAAPWVVVEVCDTGPGIPAAFQERIFDEFFRTPAATTAAHGDGIGLATSRRVARLLGGDITLRNRDDGGAIFALWLPPPAAEGERATDDDAGSTRSLARTGMASLS
jgi:signal transduction histidine kinase